MSTGDWIVAGWVVVMLAIFAPWWVGLLGLWWQALLHSLDIFRS